MLTEVLRWCTPVNALLGLGLGVLVWAIVAILRNALRRTRGNTAEQSSDWRTELAKGPFSIVQDARETTQALLAFARVFRFVIMDILKIAPGNVIGQQFVILLLAVIPYGYSFVFGRLLDEIRNGSDGIANTSTFIFTILLLTLGVWWLFDLFEKKLTYDLDQIFRQMFASYFPRIREAGGLETFQGGKEAFKLISSAERGEYFVRFFVVFSMTLVGGVIGGVIGAITILPYLSWPNQALLVLGILVFLVVRLHAARKLSLLEDSNYRALGEMTHIKGNFGRKESLKGYIAFAITTPLIARLDSLAAVVFGAQRSLNWNLFLREAVVVLGLVVVTAFASVEVLGKALKGDIPLGQVAFLLGATVAFIRSLKALIEGFALQVLGTKKMEDLYAFRANPQALVETIGGTEPFPNEDALGIEVCALDYTYPGADKPALKGLNFTIRPGAFVFVEGRNGCGKTTTYNLLQLLYQPPKNSVFLIDSKGRRFDVSSMLRDEVRRRVLHVGQSTLEMKDTFRKTLAYAAHIPIDSPESKSPEFEAKMWEVLKLACLDVQVRKFRKQLDETLAAWQDAREDLSGGNHRKLNLAMVFMSVLVGGAKVLLLDEPFTGVDPESVKKILRNVRRLAAEHQITVLLTTHAMSEIPKRAAVLALYREEDEAGHLLHTAVESGTHEELLISPDGRYRQYAAAEEDDET